MTFKHEAGVEDGIMKCSMSKLNVKARVNQMKKDGTFRRIEKRVSD